MMTDEDRHWLSQRFEQVEARFEQVEAHFRRVDARFERVEALINQVEIRFDQRLEEVETRLLTEFHKWASPFEARQRNHSSNLRALDVEVEYLADQIKKVDDRLKRVEQR